MAAMGTASLHRQSQALFKALLPCRKHERDSRDHFSMHKHNHSASSEKSLWEGQEYEEESRTINKPSVLREGAVCTEHRGTLTLGTHIPASPSRCVGSSLPLFSAKPFRFLTLSCHRFPLGAFCPSHHGSYIGVQRHNLIRRSQSAIISGL